MKRRKVLFVCLGNSCRSQMAEGFARALAPDVIEPHSAGLAPALEIAPATHEVMREKNIELTGQHPKGLDIARQVPFDLLVNMSGNKFLSKAAIPYLEWTVRDPIGLSLKIHRQVRDEIERRVRELAEQFRSEADAGNL